MSENLLSKIIAEQTEILLKNINSVVQSANLEAEFDGLNASRFIFHNTAFARQVVCEPCGIQI